MIVSVLAPCFRYVPILAASLLAQKNTDWEAVFVHDGEWEEWDRWTEALDDPRIRFNQTPEVNGEWGHPIRAAMLAQEEIHGRYTILGNGDDYFSPVLVGALSACTADVVVWSSVHHYFRYDVLRPKVEYGQIDLSSIAVRSDLAQEIGFPWRENAADYLWIQEIAGRTSDWKWLDPVLHVKN